MNGTRLRPTPTGDELAAMYPAPHDHRAYGAGHDLRVRASIAVGQWLADDCDAALVADLTAGVGTIASGIAHPRGADVILGDLATTGQRIEDSAQALEPVDVYICTETLEHLDDPAAALDLIRAKARRLLVSFPHRDDVDDNPEHLWQWTVTEAEALLHETGWRPLTSLVLQVPDGPYRYSIWGCA